MSAYAWEALLLAKRITLADPVKAHTREVDIEAGVIILFADDPDRPVGEDYQFAIDRLATADLTRIRPGLTLVFAEEDLQVVARSTGGKGMQKEVCILLATDRCVASETSIASITHQFIPLLGLRPLARLRQETSSEPSESSTIFDSSPFTRAVSEICHVFPWSSE